MKALELKVPPVVVVLFFGALMWAMAATMPIAPIAIAARPIVAAVIAGCGIAIAVSGVLSFRRAQTTIHPGTPEKASAVVDAGMYRFSRNPMYLGLLLLLIGWVVFLGDAALAALLPLFIAYMTWFQIKPEERALEANFGDAYTAYKSRVRRWL